MIKNVIKILLKTQEFSSHQRKNLFICYMKLAIKSSTHHHRQHAQGLLYPLDAFDEQAALAR